MRQINAIASNTFKIILREKTLYFIIVIAVVFGIFSLFLKPLVLGELKKIVYDFSFSIMFFMGVLIAIIIGTIVIQTEYKQKTIYLILSKPISRDKFIIGKFIGMFISILLVEIILSIVFILIILISKVPLTVDFFYSFLFIQLQLLIVCSLSIFFSSFATPITSAVFTSLTVISGIFISSALNIGHLFDKLSNVSKIFLTVLSFILPALSELDMKVLSYSNISIGLDFLFFSISYSLLYSIACLLLTIVIFSRKEFN